MCPSTFNCTIWFLSNGQVTNLTYLDQYNGTNPILKNPNYEYISNQMFGYFRAITYQNNTDNEKGEISDIYEGKRNKMDNVSSLFLNGFGRHYSESNSMIIGFWKDGY